MEFSDKECTNVSVSVVMHLPWKYKMIRLGKLKLDEECMGMLYFLCNFSINVKVFFFKCSDMCEKLLFEAVILYLSFLLKNYFRCIGTVQHLKSKFGKGYFLEIKLKDWIENLEVDRLQREIQYIFPNASRQER